MPLLHDAVGFPFQGMDSGGLPLTKRGTGTRAGDTAVFRIHHRPILLRKIDE